jgi:hypothetical protein
VKTNLEPSNNPELLSLLDAETMLTESLGIEERRHRRIMALSFVQMAIAALDDDQAVRAASS